MAVMINGARVDEQVYEFAFEDSTGTLYECESYDEAKRLLDGVHGRGGLKMCCVYKTEWMDAKLCRSFTRCG